LNDTHGYHIKATNSTCNMISWFRLKCPCPSVRGKQNFFSAQSNYKYCRSVIKEKYFDIYKNKQNVRQNPCCVGSLFQYIYKWFVKGGTRKWSSFEYGFGFL